MLYTKISCILLFAYNNVDCQLVQMIDYSIINDTFTLAINKVNTDPMDAIVYMYILRYVLYMTIKTNMYVRM
jgi:hypothetical protein